MNTSPSNPGEQPRNIPWPEGVVFNVGNKNGDKEGPFRRFGLHDFAETYGYDPARISIYAGHGAPGFIMYDDDEGHPRFTEFRIKHREFEAAPEAENVDARLRKFVVEVRGGIGSGLEGDAGSEITIEPADKDEGEGTSITGGEDFLWTSDPPQAANDEPEGTLDLPGPNDDVIDLDSSSISSAEMQAASPYIRVTPDIEGMLSPDGKHKAGSPAELGIDLRNGEIIDPQDVLAGDVPVRIVTLSPEDLYRIRSYIAQGNAVEYLHGPPPQAAPDGEPLLDDRRFDDLKSPNQEDSAVFLFDDSSDPQAAKIYGDEESALFEILSNPVEDDLLSALRSAHGYAASDAEFYVMMDSLVSRGFITAKDGNKGRTYEITSMGREALSQMLSARMQRNVRKPKAEGEKRVAAASDDRSPDQRVRKDETQPERKSEDRGDDSGILLVDDLEDDSGIGQPLGNDAREDDLPESPTEDENASEDQPSPDTGSGGGRDEPPEDRGSGGDDEDEGGDEDEQAESPFIRINENVMDLLSDDDKDAVRWLGDSCINIQSGGIFSAGRIEAGDLSGAIHFLSDESLSRLRGYVSSKSPEHIRPGVPQELHAAPDESFQNLDGVDALDEPQDQEPWRLPRAIMTDDTGDESGRSVADESKATGENLVNQNIRTSSDALATMTAEWLIARYGLGWIPWVKYLSLTGNSFGFLLTSFSGVPITEAMERIKTWRYNKGKKSKLALDTTGALMRAHGPMTDEQLKEANERIQREIVHYAKQDDGELIDSMDEQELLRVFHEYQKQCPAIPNFRESAEAPLLHAQECYIRFLDLCQDALSERAEYWRSEMLFRDHTSEQFNAILNDTHHSDHGIATLLERDHESAERRISRMKLTPEQKALLAHYADPSRREHLFQTSTAYGRLIARQHALRQRIARVSGAAAVNLTLASLSSGLWALAPLAFGAAWEGWKYWKERPSKKPFLSINRFGKLLGRNGTEDLIDPTVAQRKQIFFTTGALVLYKSKEDIKDDAAAKNYYEQIDKLMRGANVGKYRDPEKLADAAQNKLVANLGKDETKTPVKKPVIALEKEEKTALEAKRDGLERDIAQTSGEVRTLESQEEQAQETIDEYSPLLGKGRSDLEKRQIESTLKAARKSISTARGQLSEKEERLKLLRNRLTAVEEKLEKGTPKKDAVPEFHTFKELDESESFEKAFCVWVHAHLEKEPKTFWKGLSYLWGSGGARILRREMGFMGGSAVLGAAAGAVGSWGLSFAPGLLGSIWESQLLWGGIAGIAGFAGYIVSLKSRMMNGTLFRDMEQKPPSGTPPTT